MTLPLEYNALIEHVVWRRTPVDAAPSEAADLNATVDPAAPISQARGGQPALHWWSRRGRRLADIGKDMDPDDIRNVPYTYGGAEVKVLHYAVEAKPYLGPRQNCRAARRVRPP